MKKYKSKFADSKSLKEGFHAKDELLVGITFEDLMTAVESNEPTIDEASVMKVFKEMQNANIADAKYDLKSNIKEIVKILNK